eukprot:TRINITY_DN13771_c0_g1_i1.p1 TRINITY_DN13771_c0_g1~~TRINITY_DN13771_c0_g1_i1.p1  ORF type:complete len:635 (-),score=120.72 TRINITY_DN13771_c0_g1_i1:28-1932(-)
MFPPPSVMACHRGMPTMYGAANVGGMPMQSFDQLPRHPVQKPAGQAPAQAPAQPPGPPSWIYSVAKDVRQYLPEFLLPWVFFGLSLVASASPEPTLLTYLTVILCISLAGGFMLLSRGRSWQVLAYTLLLLTLAGAVVGEIDRNYFLYGTELVQNSQWYENVDPAEDPFAKKDAGALTFTTATSIDVARSVGYQSGQRYCVAPIVGGESQSTVGYWAVGADCCKHRGQFHCGKVLGPNKTGIVLISDGGEADKELAQYLTAAKMAAMVYDLSLPASPTFVLWADHVGAYVELMEGKLWRQVKGLLGGLLVITLLLAVILPAARLTSVLSAPVPFPEELPHMRFGSDCDFLSKPLQRLGLTAPPPYKDPPSLELDLLTQRAYWSGEIIHDYCFHVCNVHLFLGVLGAHPANPFRRLDRTLLAIFVANLIVFPLAYLDVAFAGAAAPEASFGLQLFRLITMVALINGPRVAMKNYLQRVAVQDSVAVLEEGAREHGIRHAKALMWEIATFMTFGIMTVIICILCAKGITGAGYPLWPSLCGSSDALCGAFVMEAIFELIMPMHAKSKTGEDTYMIGFFSRWRHERDMAAKLAVFQKHTKRPDLAAPNHKAPHSAPAPGGASEADLRHRAATTGLSL